MRKLLIPPDSRSGINDKIDLALSWMLPKVDRNTNIRQFLPTRLLNFFDGQIKLVNSKNHVKPDESSADRELLKYVALSHRWGASQHFVCKTTMIGQLRNGYKVV
jgi:hypothetical protein